MAIIDEYISRRTVAIISPICVGAVLLTRTTPLIHVALILIWAHQEICTQHHVVNVKSRMLYLTCDTVLIKLDSPYHKSNCLHACGNLADSCSKMILWCWYSSVHRDLSPRLMNIRLCLKNIMNDNCIQSP